jgi:hypothetical protein
LCLKVHISLPVALAVPPQEELLVETLGAVLRLRPAATQAPREAVVVERRLPLFRRTAASSLC